jgi:hypothetical protein
LLNQINEEYMLKILATKKEANGFFFFFFEVKWHFYIQPKTTINFNKGNIIVHTVNDGRGMKIYNIQILTSRSPPPPLPLFGRVE